MYVPVFTISGDNMILIENVKCAMMYDFGCQRLCMNYIVHIFTYRIAETEKTKILFF